MNHAAPAHYFNQPSKYVNKAFRLQGAGMLLSHGVSLEKEKH
jgi:hypothetical protein